MRVGSYNVWAGFYHGGGDNLKRYVDVSGMIPRYPERTQPGHKDQEIARQNSRGFFCASVQKQKQFVTDRFLRSEGNVKEESAFVEVWTVGTSDMSGKWLREKKTSVPKHGKWHTWIQV